MDGAKNVPHVSNSHTKFGWILSKVLRGDSVKDGRTFLHLDSWWVLTVLEKVDKKASNFGYLKYPIRVNL